jgi:hypothetical protein
MNADAGAPGPSSTVQCLSLVRFFPSGLAPREPTVLRALVGNGKNVPGKDPRRDPGQVAQGSQSGGPGRASALGHDPTATLVR